MIVTECHSNTGLAFKITCRCGFETAERYTMTAAGEEMDAHMAQRFPTPSTRRECYTSEGCTHQYVHHEGVCMNCKQDRSGL